MVLRIGTSGWLYRDWRGRLYPQGLPQRLELEHYAAGFGTVEVNNAFYRLPAREVFEGWARRTPDDFVVAVKVSRFLTHIKRLREPAEPVHRLLDRAAGLGTKVGPFLLQLPPTLQRDDDLLDACLAEFPRGTAVAVEVRHPTWEADGVRAVLERRDAALVWADRRGPLAPLWRTASWGYVRFHDGGGSPAPRYDDGALDAWLERLAAAYAPSEDVWVYFNNDPGGAAVDDACTLARLAAARGLPATRVPDLSPP